MAAAILLNAIKQGIQFSQHGSKQRRVLTLRLRYIRQCFALPAFAGRLLFACHGFGDKLGRGYGTTGQAKKIPFLERVAIKADLSGAIVDVRFRQCLWRWI